MLKGTNFRICIAKLSLV